MRSVALRWRRNRDIKSCKHPFPTSSNRRLNYFLNTRAARPGNWLTQDPRALERPALGDRAAPPLGPGRAPLRPAGGGRGGGGGRRPCPGGGGRGGGGRVGGCGV